MNTVVRRFALPLAAALLLAAAAYVLLGTIAELILGNWEVGRLFPFANAHLREEAAEGQYAPLTDPLFVSFSVLVAIVSFGPSMFWGASRASRPELWFVWLAALTGVGLLATTFASELSLQAPSTIFAAALFSLAACFVASGVGIWIASLVAPAATLASIRT